MRSTPSTTSSSLLPLLHGAEHLHEQRLCVVCEASSIVIFLTLARYHKDSDASSPTSSSLPWNAKTLSHSSPSSSGLGHRRRNLSPPIVPELDRLHQPTLREHPHLPISFSPLIAPCFVHLYRARALLRRTSLPASVSTSLRCRMYPVGSHRCRFLRSVCLFVLGSSGPSSSAAL